LFLFGIYCLSIGVVVVSYVAVVKGNTVAGTVVRVSFPQSHDQHQFYRFYDWNESSFNVTNMERKIKENE
jgi:hypothetical protein